MPLNEFPFAAAPFFALELPEQLVAFVNLLSLPALLIERGDLGLELHTSLCPREASVYIIRVDQFEDYLQIGIAGKQVLTALAHSSPSSQSAGSTATPSVFIGAL